MDASIWIVLGICLLVIISFGIIIYLSSLKKEEEFFSDTLVKNYKTQFTNGHSGGMLITTDISPKHRVRIIYKPRVDFEKRIKNGEKVKIKPEHIWVKTYCIVPLIKGTHDSEFNEIQIFPENPEDFPEGLLSTPFGRGMADYVAHCKANETAIDVMRREREIEDYLLRLTKGQGLVKQYLEKDRELTNTFLKGTTEKGSNPKPNSFPYGNNGER